MALEIESAKQALNDAIGYIKENNDWLAQQPMLELPRDQSIHVAEREFITPASLPTLPPLRFRKLDDK